MTENPSEVARRLREMADQFDPQETLQNVYRHRWTGTPPIVTALQTLDQFDDFIAIGMTRRMAVSTTARMAGLPLDAIEVALSQRNKSRIEQRNFVIDWMTRHRSLTQGNSRWSSISNNWKYDLPKIGNYC